MPTTRPNKKGVQYTLPSPGEHGPAHAPVWAPLTDGEACFARAVDYTSAPTAIRYFLQTLAPVRHPLLRTPLLLIGRECQACALGFVCFEVSPGGRDPPPYGGAGTGHLPSWGRRLQKYKVLHVQCMGAPRGGRPSRRVIYFTQGFTKSYGYAHRGRPTGTALTGAVCRVDCGLGDERRRVYFHFSRSERSTKTRASSHVAVPSLASFELLLCHTYGTTLARDTRASHRCTYDHNKNKS